MALKQRNTAQANVMHTVQWLTLFCVILLGTVPLILAILRLWSVTQVSPLEALRHFPEQIGAMDALRFTLIEALLSTLLTVVLGLPVAWSLGRYQWRGIRSKRALFYLPFVTPPIVAAAGFLALILSLIHI